MAGQLPDISTKQMSHKMHLVANPEIAQGISYIGLMVESPNSLMQQR